METRRLRREERGDVGALLEVRGLPPLPPNIPLSNVFVALEDGAVIGVVVLKVVARRGLLCSAAVSEAHENRGIRATLVRSLIARAYELGLRELYLLTETESELFAPLGFSAVSRDRVPSEITSTSEYREQCPEPAEVMRLELDTRL